jgi:hypothetical protein
LFQQRIAKKVSQAGVLNNNFLIFIYSHSPNLGGQFPENRNAGAVPRFARRQSAVCFLRLR